MYTCVYIYINVYTCTYVYIYTYTHTLHHITLHDMTIHYITLHHITLHYITLHYMTLHYMTLHHITLHYIRIYILCEICPGVKFKMCRDVAFRANWMLRCTIWPHDMHDRTTGVCSVGTVYQHPEWIWRFPLSHKISGNIRILTHGYGVSSMDMEVSEKSWKYPQSSSSYYIGSFDERDYKPSMLGYLHDYGTPHMWN